jgi:hypothetical protein
MFLYRFLKQIQFIYVWFISGPNLQKTHVFQMKKNKYKKIEDIQTVWLTWAIAIVHIWDNNYITHAKLKLNCPHQTK